MTDRPPSPAETDLADLDGLIRRMRSGERRAISRVITELERASPAMPRLLERLKPHLGGAVVIGFTGPPGAGKSTLVNSVIAEARRRKRSVGVIAVDPSSPVSGGAILGDRIRMTASLDDDGVFVRSLASRGHLGGLSPAAVRIIDALDAAGFDLILVETVGTGQSEIDVASVTDLRIVLAAPGLGDDIQAMKSGLLEIADILVVNKADRPGAEETHQQLASALHLRAASAEVPILKTTATTGGGVAALVELIEQRSVAVRAEPLAIRRRQRARFLIARAAAEIVSERIRSGDAEGIDALSDAILDGAATAESAARQLLKD
jgi:LAO/AO transport system kinase